MPHPYTQTELEAMDHASHTGVCGHCLPADPEAPTDEERLHTLFCPHCEGGVFIAHWRITGTALCKRCGGDSVSAWIDPEISQKPNQTLCLNCRIQEHDDHCHACASGWPEAS